MKRYAFAILVLALASMSGSAFAVYGAADSAPGTAAAVEAAVAGEGSAPVAAATATQAQGPQPELYEVVEAEELECGTQDSLRERTRCRVQQRVEAAEVAGTAAGASNATAAQQRERETLRHMPEECRQLAGTENAACLARYRVMNACIAKDNDRARESCMKGELALTRVREQKQECQSGDTEGTGACIRELRSNVYELVKFRFQNLIAKAELLGEKGADEELVVDFIADVEEKSMEFDAAETIDERKVIVQEVAQLWREFVRAAMEDIRESAQDDEVVS